MKHNKRDNKQYTPKYYRYYISGTGRIDDTKPINLSEEVKPDIVIDGQPGYKADGALYQVKFSKEYGNTVYDVLADFSTEGKETVLNQFQRLILSDQN